MSPKRRLLTLIFACLCFKKSLLIKNNNNNNSAYPMKTKKPSKSNRHASPKHISDFLTQAKYSIFMKETTEQKWLGAFTTAQSEDKEMATDVCKLLQKWRNIPYIVYSVSTSLRQQLLPTKTYEKAKLKQPRR